MKELAGHIRTHLSSVDSGKLIMEHTLVLPLILMAVIEQIPL